MNRACDETRFHMRASQALLIIPAQHSPFMCFSAICPSQCFSTFSTFHACAPV